MALYEIAKQVEIYTSDTTERYFIGVAESGEKVAVRLHVRGTQVPFQPIQLTDTMRTRMHGGTWRDHSGYPAEFGKQSQLTRRGGERRG